MASGMTREEILAFFERRQALWDARDAAGLAADYTDDAAIDSPMLGQHTGRAAAEDALRALFSAFLDWKVTTDELLVDGDRAVLIGAIEGTQVGPFMGLPPSGKRFRLPLAAVYELRDGKIARDRRIYDFTGLLLQLGVLRARPA